MFFKRYYEEIAAENDLYFKLVLNNTKERCLLQRIGGRLPLREIYIAKENKISIEENIKVVELRASYKEIANRVIKQIFEIFNFDCIDESIIDEWQTKFLERRT